jgi:hypothetical protein
MDKLAVALLVASVLAPAAGTLWLPRVFSDHAVLQRERAGIPSPLIWVSCATRTIVAAAAWTRLRAA